MSIIQTPKRNILHPEKRLQFPNLILLPEGNAACMHLSLGLWMSGTIYLLLSEKPHHLTLLRLDCEVLSLFSFYQIQNCLITSAGRHTRAPATVSPLCGDLIVFFDRNRNKYPRIYYLPLMN